MIGAVSGPGVLVFLDGHCEVNVIWLQPLLEIIQEDQQSMWLALQVMLSVWTCFN